MRSNKPGISRRRFIQLATAGASALAVQRHPVSASSASTQSLLPSPESSGIDHVVVVMMENRSFDHMLGWLPRADARQAGFVYFDDAGVPHETYPLAPDYRGCGHPDPDHSYQGGRIEYNGGACDGWLRAGDNDVYAIGYYKAKDLAFFARAASDWTVCDRYFSAIMGPTFPNRFYQHAAQTDRLSNTFDLSVLPTIWDRLADAGLTGRYYFNDAPFLALWGAKYLSIGRPFVAFLADCAAGTLPHVSFVEPRFIFGPTGVSNDDHPHADIRDGQAFLNLVYSAVADSPLWDRTVLIINYDEWGGFFEHVAPPTAAVPEADRLAGHTDGLMGFRVPCLIFSPFSLRKSVSHQLFDHTSILKMIEWRWGLEPLTVRDASANNIAEVLDFTQAGRPPISYNVPPGPFGTLCAPFEPDKWSALVDVAAAFGWGEIVSAT